MATRLLHSLENYTHTHTHIYVYIYIGGKRGFSLILKKRSGKTKTVEESLFDFTNVFKEYFEEMALGSTSLKSSMWLRHVDDELIIWPYEEDVKTLLDYVNFIRPTIQFTMEKEPDKKWFFLDKLITRTERGIRSSMN